MTTHAKAWGARTWVGQFANREEAAAGYTKLLSTYGAKWDGWPYINTAIAERWSMSGLKQIKAKAWG